MYIALSIFITLLHTREYIMYLTYLYLGSTSLMNAVLRNSRTDTIKILLEHGAKVNTKDNAG